MDISLKKVIIPTGYQNVNRKVADKRSIFRRKHKKCKTLSNHVKQSSICFDAPIVPLRDFGKTNSYPQLVNCDLKCCIEEWKLKNNISGRTEREQRS
jgi:hypothetical protein